MGFCYSSTQMVCNKDGEHHTHRYQQANKFFLVIVPTLGSTSDIVGLMAEIKERSFYHVEQFGMLVRRR